MNLHGQSQKGYAMAALLIALAIMAVMATVAMPVWRLAAQREKEQELLFRGQQYARAIGLFERKYANTPPPNLDVLVQERFLRRKYKDPITGLDFVPIPGGQGAAAPATPNGTAAPRAATPAPSPVGTAPVASASPAGASVAGGGIIGVTSKSTTRSLRIYNGATHYNEWRFVYAPPVATPGAGSAGQPAPGRGNPGGAPGPLAPGGPGRGAPQTGGPGSSTGPAGRGGAPTEPGAPFGRGR
jgi:type II secretory pathway pseudopilin PulG